MTTDTEFEPLRKAHLEELNGRYGAILARTGFDGVVLHSGRRRSRRQFDDQEWPLLPAPHFAHWLPLAHPECLVIVTPGHRPRLVRVVSADFWEQPPVDEVGAEGFEVTEIREPNAARALVPAGRIAFVGEADAAIIEAFSDEHRNPPALLAALEHSRSLKTAYEVACLLEANRRALPGHRRLAEVFAGADLSELQLHLAYLSATDQDDVETPYKNIVAKGQNAATLHHVTYGRSAAGDGSLLVDAGASVRGYGSDITRTHVRGRGEAVDRFRDLVAGLDGAQRRLCSAVHVGLRYEELHERSHHEIGALLRDVGLLRVSVEEAVTSGITRAFYPHGLGHSLGLQTHDPGCAVVRPQPNNPFLRNTATIAAGQVFTIEPGFYFIRSLLEPLRHNQSRGMVDWSLVEALQPFGGARIEDDLYVGGDGVRNLTRDVFE